MATTSNVNDKVIINTPPSYFHCFKLTDSSYAIFDSKMDMPVVIGSLALIKGTKLPRNSTVFYYEISSKGYFEKLPDKTIEVKGDVVHRKPPLRYHYISEKELFYQVFKLSPILYVLWDSDVSSPIIYGSYQRLQATINKIPQGSTIYYYKEDLTVKNSFKYYAIFKGRAPSKL